MKAALLLATSFTLCFCAIGETGARGKSKPAWPAGANGPYVWLPPVQFDYKPRGRVVEKQLDYWAIDAACRARMGSIAERGLAGMPARFEACAFPLKNFCIVLIPRADGENIDRVTQARLRRHEYGHCNGWPMDHPGGR